MTTEPQSPPAPPAPARDDPALLDQIDGLSRQLTELREEVERLEERSVYATLLTTLRSRDYELLRDIPITVEQNDEETCVSWFEVSVTGVADTADGALMSFEERLLRLFTDLQGKPESELGPLPSRWKRALAAAIRHA